MTEKTNTTPSPAAEFFAMKEEIKSQGEAIKSMLEMHKLNAESTTKIVEAIRQVEYTTGESYTVTGTNINIPGNPQRGAGYSIMTQGAPFQFSETYLGPGVAKETWIDRKTVEDSTTNSISVFTQ